MKRIAIFALTLGFLASARVPASLAGIILGDRGIHPLSGASPEVLLQNGTTLNVHDGTIINAPSLTDGIAGDSSPNHIIVTGGIINGGSNEASFAGFANSGIKMEGGTLNISGGVFRGGDASFSPGSGVDTRDTAVTISGGAFYAGNITTGGYAGNGYQASGGEILISGGEFHGGLRSDGYVSGYGALFGDDGGRIPTHVVITGGTFTSDGLMQLGAFSLGVAVATVDLKGGKFTGDLFVDGYRDSVLNIYGTDLTMTAPFEYSRHITGTLLDGTPISIDAFVNSPAAINLINVPEPSSFLLAGLASIALTAYPRKARYAALGAI